MSAEKDSWGDVREISWDTLESSWVVCVQRHMEGTGTQEDQPEFVGDWMGTSKVDSCVSVSLGHLSELRPEIIRGRDFRMQVVNHGHGQTDVY